MLSEHIKRIKYMSDYRFNESVKYERVMDNIDEDDEIENALAGGLEDTEDEEVSNEEPQTEPQLNTEPETKDDVQTEIIKLNLSAIEKLNNSLKELTSNVSDLSAKYDNLHAEVDKVRDPSDQEKFQNRKDDSYPFKYHLNDLWNNNWFKDNQDQYLNNFREDGIVKLDDDLYIADYDKLPKLSPSELKKSFQ